MQASPRSRASPRSAQDSRDRRVTGSDAALPALNLCCWTGHAGGFPAQARVWGQPAQAVWLQVTRVTQRQDSMSVPGWRASTDGRRAPDTHPRESRVHRPALTPVFLPLGCAWMGRAREQLCLPLPRGPHGDPAAPGSSQSPSAGFPAVTVLLCAPETPGEARSDLCTLGVWLEFKMS